MPVPSWTQAVAAVLDADGIVRGTAFFVGQDVALTCEHVLDAAGGGSVSLKRVGSEVAEAVVERDCDEDLDLALLRVSTAADGSWLKLDPEGDLTGRRLFSHGFPRGVQQKVFADGYPMKPATVSGPTTVTWRGQQVQVFVLADADVEKGMSGAPAVEDGTSAVVGILRFSEKGKKDALAVPAEAAMLRWPGLPTSTAGAALNYADLSKASDPVGAAGWREFDPTQLHCVVVGSEGGGADDPDASLRALVEEMLASEDAVKLWKSFTAACGGRRLLHLPLPRQFDAAYSKKHVNIASFDVCEAFTTTKSLETAARLLVEADLVFFDVTGFEPGVMLLLGVRAATRRGVTINSLGGGWTEGKRLDRPFNLSDLSLSSHTRTSEDDVGDDPRIARLAARARTGFDQLARHPHYLDLPVYDALRQLGSEEHAWRSIPVDDEVLVLCSYDHRYAKTWRTLKGQLKTALSDKGTTSVVRLQDLPTPQLVSQSLYERIRRCAGCVADWTYASPSTFFELGVRLAASPWNVVQIASTEWLSDPKRPQGATREYAGQIARMRELFEPLTYAGSGDDDIVTRVAERLIRVREENRGRGLHPVRQAAAAALERTEERLPDPADELRDRADALYFPGKENVPQALFFEVKEIKADQERAALERRLAAWLYLDHRVEAAGLDPGDERKEMWKELGTLVADALYLSQDEADQRLAASISERVL